VDQTVKGGAEPHQLFVLLHGRSFDCRPGQLFDIGQPETALAILIGLQARLAKSKRVG
jgi:hypothetical protein